MNTYSQKENIKTDASQLTVDLYPAGIVSDIIEIDTSGMPSPRRYLSVNYYSDEMSLMITPRRKIEITSGETYS